MIDDTLLVIARYFLAALLLAGAVHKLAGLERFRLAVTDYGILPLWAIPLAAVALPVLEMLMAVALLWQPARALGGMAAAALFLIYAMGIGVNLWRGRRNMDCGCSLGGGHGISPLLPLRNGALALLAATVAALPVAALDGFTYANAAACGIVLFLIYAGLEIISANAQRITAGGLRS